MARLFLFLFCFCPLFCCGLDQSAAREFERLTKNAVGVLPSLPEEIREKRSGTMQQRVEISSEGILTLSFSFPCRFPTGDGRKMVEHTITSKKSFPLGEFWASSKRRYEVSSLFNTLAFYDHDVAWILAFHSTSEVNSAAKVLANLVESAQHEGFKESEPSKIARKNGFRFVVFAPRAATLEEAVRLLKVPEQSSNMTCWLTKQESLPHEELFKESNNALPIFLYDLDILDKTPFYTISSSWQNTFCQFDLDEDYVQSAFSDDEKDLERFFQKASYCGVRFEIMPTTLSAHTIFSLYEPERTEQKVKARGIESAQILQVTPKYFTLEIPQGPTSTWFIGLNENSDDVLRLLFWEKKMTRENLSKILYREFPELTSLLKAKSRYRKDLTLEECLLMKFYILMQVDEELSSFARRVVRVACFANELGAPFGPDSELYYNSWPLALSLAEKVGLDDKEKDALSLLLHDQPMTESKTLEKRSLLSLLLQEAKKAAELEIPLGEWISMKTVFTLTLSKQFRSCPGWISTYLKNLREIARSYKILLPFGMPFGAFCFKERLPGKRLLSAYLWAARDSKHREGLALKKRRERFERMMIEKPHSPWRGRFWDWLDAESGKDKIRSEVYLESEKERKPFLAIFENGDLISPINPSEKETTLLFVVDLKGELFLAPQKRLLSSEEQSFSHASFFSGGKVAAAGKMRVRGGKVLGITNDSTQYHSGPKELKIVLELLERSGVSIDNVSVTINSTPRLQEQFFESGKKFIQK